MKIQKITDSKRFLTTSFKNGRASEQGIYGGRLTELAAFEGEHFDTLYEPGILTKVQARIHARLRKYGRLIQPPHGPATIHFDRLTTTEF